MSPRVSIGLPVYNGERFLSAAIESILAQDFGDFELIIADNASTDRSRQIAADHAAQDDRISIHPSDVNRGAAWNFNRCVHLATGHYFKWAAHDDELAPTCLSRCMRIMDREPDVVLCYSRILQIDADSNVTRELPSWSALDEAPLSRLRSVLLSMSHATAMFGLTRRAELLRTRLERSYGASDRALLAQLALMGKLREVPEYLFRDREYPERSGGAIHDRRIRDAFVGASRNIRWSMPRWQLLGGYISAFVTAPVPVQTRAAALSLLPRWILRQKGNLAYDVVRVLKPIA